VQKALGSPGLQRRAALTAAAVVAVGVALWFASLIPRTLSVFIIAAFIAFGVGPIVTRLERWVARPAAIALVYVALVATAIVVVVLVVPVTLAQVQSIAADSPSYLAAAQGWIDATQRFMVEHLGRNYLPPGYNDLRGLLAARVSNALNVALNSLANILIGTFTATFIGISAMVLSAFFLLRGEALFDAAYELLPAPRRIGARALVHEITDVFGSYVAGQAALCFVTGVLIFAFTLVSGFKFALLLGIIAGVAYAVPFVGMVVTHVIALGLAAPAGLQTVIWTQVIIFTIARVADNVLVPKVMSESVGVSPIVVMFATFAGGELFGLPGLLLGIPAAALAKVAWRFFRSQPVRPADITIKAPDGTETAVGGDGEPAAGRGERAKIA
jgi:predicted PurR-regulated permease PerM